MTYSQVTSITYLSETFISMLVRVAITIEYVECKTLLLIFDLDQPAIYSDSE